MTIDLVRLRRCDADALDNAAKHSSEDARIELTAERSDRQMQLVVRDAGSGLTETEKEPTYQRLFRGKRHAATTRGFGPGLRIAQTFVAALDGTIEAASNGPGRRTTLSIVLPPLAGAPPHEPRQLVLQSHG
jgi:two-component system sensor histidine kinase KdpD